MPKTYFAKRWTGILPCQWTWEKRTLQNSTLAANIPYTTGATEDGAGTFSHKDWTI